MAITHKIRHNKRNKRYMVFAVNDQIKGFGAWKIKKSFKTRKEALNWIKTH